MEIACASYVHFVKSSWFKGKIRSEQAEEFERSWVELERLFVEAAQEYRARREEERRKDKES